MLIAKPLTIVSPLLKNRLTIRNIFNQIGHFTWKILHWREILVSGRNVEKSLEEALTLFIVSSCYLLRRLFLSYYPLLWMYLLNIRGIHLLLLIPLALSKRYSFHYPSQL